MVMTHDRSDKKEKVSLGSKYRGFSSRTSTKGVPQRLLSRRSVRGCIPWKRRTVHIHKYVPLLPDRLA